MNKFKFNCGKIEPNFSFFINDVSSMEKPLSNTMIFAKIFNKNFLDRIINVEESLIILDNLYKGKIPSYLYKKNIIIFSNNPRALFYNYLKIIRKESLKNELGKEKKLKIGSNCYIAESVILGNNIIIGDNCIINDGVIIKSNTVIGNNCYIGENTVIGCEGLGVDRDFDNNLYNSIHLGGVEIKDNVEIASLVNICSGRIEKTIIGKNCVIGGGVYISHDVVLGQNTLVNVGSVICGNVKIKDNVEIGPNSTISNDLIIEDNSSVSIGSTVISKVKKNTKVTGYFAISHNKFLNIIKYLLTKADD